MSFKYSCIGDNTPENREWLEKIGYKPFAGILFKEAEYVNTDDEDHFYTLPETPIEFYIEEGCISSIGNPTLFQAVTAMRDGSDYMQWFTNGIHWYLCESVRFKNSALFDKEYNTQVKDGTDYHKATLEELINHFK